MYFSLLLIVVNEHLIKSNPHLCCNSMQRYICADIIIKVLIVFFHISLKGISAKTIFFQKGFSLFF